MVASKSMHYTWPVCQVTKLSKETFSTIKKYFLNLTGQHFTDNRSMLNVPHHIL